LDILDGIEYEVVFPYIIVCVGKGVIIGDGIASNKVEW
jgi:hypothetical protein